MNKDPSQSPGSNGNGSASATEAPQAEAAVGSVSFHQVVACERAAIAQRRKHVKLALSEHNGAADLGPAGLALSGGGLRCACFSLGVVQALEKTGLWKHFDYLSTVSGGGYLGGYLSALALREPISAEHSRLRADGHQPSDVRRLIYGGKYLLHFGLLLNHYLVGFLLINLVVVSGLIALASLVAFLWRCLDYDVVRDNLRLLNLQRDVYAAFWPFVLCFIVWVVAWLVSYFRSGREAPGATARHLLLPMGATLVIGTAVALGNGTISVPLSNELPVVPGIWTPILAAVVTGLLPFLRPKRVLQSGRSPAGTWQRWVFRIASTSLLFGLPLVLVGAFAHENISGVANYRSAALRPAEVRDWPGLVRVYRAIEENPSAPAGSLERLARHQEPSTYEQGSWWTRLRWLVGSSLWIATPLDEHLRAREKLQQARKEVCASFTTDVLQRTDLPWAAFEQAPASAGAQGLLPRAWDGRLNPVETVRLNNLELLERRYPEVLYPRGTVLRTIVIEADQKRRLIWFAVAGVIFLALGFINLNTASLYKFYRDRVDAGFLSPVYDDLKGPRLADLRTTDYGGPYHLLGTTLNQFANREVAIDARRPRREQHLAARAEYQNTPFLFSQLYCGSPAVGFVKTSDYAKLFPKGLYLADAMALSGAALSPEQLTNSLVAFLMLVFNLRVGQWLPHPQTGTRRPAFVHALLWSFLRGHRGCRYCFVTDGGQSENLGVLALLERRCRFILAVDATRDALCRFTDLANLVRRARVCDGIELGDATLGPGEGTDYLPAHLLRPEATSGRSAAHFLVARIRYPKAHGEGPSDGVLIYVKPSFTGDESVDLQEYRAANPGFPHQPTADQSFDEVQVEAHRHLGFHIGMQVCEAIRRKVVPDAQSFWEMGPLDFGCMCGDPGSPPPPAPPPSPRSGYRETERPPFERVSLQKEGGRRRRG